MDWVNTEYKDVIAGAFDGAMQVFVETWNNHQTFKVQCAASYGAASFALLVWSHFYNLRDLEEMEKVDKAREFLNDAARQLGLPETN